MGQPADISARLRFMFPGCLKRAGTLSNGHRTAKEEAPLKGEGGCAPWGYHWVKVEQGQTEMASLCLYIKTVRLAGQEVQGTSAEDADY